MSRIVWRVTLGSDAEQDFVQIIENSFEKFGPRQAGTYRTTLLEAIRLLKQGPDIIGSKSRDGIGKRFRTLHVARAGRKGRHFFLYRAMPDQKIDVVRILFDAMDLAQHVPKSIDN